MISNGRASAVPDKTHYDNACGTHSNKLWATTRPHTLGACVCVCVRDYKAVYKPHAGLILFFSPPTKPNDQQNALNLVLGPEQGCHLTRVAGDATLHWRYKMPTALQIRRKVSAITKRHVLLSDSQNAPHAA